MIALLALVPRLAPRGPASDGALGAAVEACAAPLEGAGMLAGVLLVARGDEIPCERAFGSANHELGVANTPDTRSCIASLSKPLTIALTVRLIEERELAVEDTLERWIRGCANGDRITVSHLLNHRAGFPHRVTTDEEECVPRTAAERVEPQTWPRVGDLPR